MISRADVFWLVGEINLTDIEIKAGNKSSYVAGRRIAYTTVICRLMRIDRADFRRYMEWVGEQVESGKRVGSLEEPPSWIRKNPK